jgi:hypothetical protein
MNNVNNPLGAINIGNLQTDGILNIGTNTSRTAVGTINIGSGAAGTNLSVINLSSSSSGGIININRPLTLNYLPSENTGPTQLGYKLPGTSTGATTTSGSALLKLWDVRLTAGTWMMLGCCNFNNPGLNSFYYLSISIGLNIDNNFAVSNVYTTNNSYLAQVSRIQVVNGNTTYNLMCQTGYTCPVNAISFNVYRIA